MPCYEYRPKRIMIEIDEREWLMLLIIAGSKRKAKELIHKLIRQYLNEWSPIMFGVG
ncbi:MAG: hypothetical protein ACXQTI_10920 [Candidatus Nezhaarchaeales archaeon]